MKFTKKSIYIGLFSVLYLIVAFSSFWHACAFFGLANNSWMSIILAFAFEIGQAAVLFSLLTSKKDRSRVMPWVLMTMFTLVQVIGNVFSSYKYIILNSIENLRFFKEPIFIWTTIPDDQATVIIVYLVGALLPIASLLLTSMITNYLSDQEEIKELENKPNELTEETKQKLTDQLNEALSKETPESWNEFLDKSKDEEQKIKGTDQDGGVIGELGDDGLKVFKESLKSRDYEIEQLKKDYDKLLDEKFKKEQQFQDALDKTGDLNNSLLKKDEEIENLKKELEELKNQEQQKLSESEKKDLIKTFNELNKEPVVYDPDNIDKKKIENLLGVDQKQMEDLIKNGIQEDKEVKPSHFINQ